MTTPASEPQMLLAYFAAARKHPRDVFVAKHPYPVLLYTPSRVEQESAFTTASGVHSIELLRSQGTPAGELGTKTMVATVQKSSRNPFPDQFYVGRADNNDLIFDHASVSKSHAYLKEGDGGWSLFDMESSNGTAIDAKRVAPYVATKVPDSATIAFGDVICQWMMPGTFFDYVTLQIAGT